VAEAGDTKYRSSGVLLKVSVKLSKNGLEAPSPAVDIHSTSSCRLALASSEAAFRGVADAVSVDGITTGNTISC